MICSLVPLPGLSKSIHQWGALRAMLGISKVKGRLWGNVRAGFDGWQTYLNLNALIFWGNNICPRGVVMVNERALSKLAMNGESCANQRTGYGPSCLGDEDLQDIKRKTVSFNLEIHVESGRKSFHTFWTTDLVSQSFMYET